MHRSPRTALSLALVSCLALGLAFGRAQDEVTVEAKTVKGPISVLLAQGGGNVGVSSGSDGILLVDDQFEKIAPEIEKALAKLASEPAKAAPRLLVNTHHHGDHTDGNKHLEGRAVIARTTCARACRPTRPRPGPCRS
jgi:glyoxylase-like metal-dependent hydrolase (beta-lactamase superfamily II)